MLQKKKEKKEKKKTRKTRSRVRYMNESPTRVASSWSYVAQESLLYKGKAILTDNTNEISAGWILRFSFYSFINILCPLKCRV